MARELNADVNTAVGDLAQAPSFVTRLGTISEAGAIYPSDAGTRDYTGGVVNPGLSDDLYSGEAPVTVAAIEKLERERERDALRETWRQENDPRVVGITTWTRPPCRPQARAHLVTVRPNIAARRRRVASRGSPARLSDGPEPPHLVRPARSGGRRGVAGGWQ